MPHNLALLLRPTEGLKWPRTSWLTWTHLSGSRVPPITVGRPLGISLMPLLWSLWSIIIIRHGSPKIFYPCLDMIVNSVSFHSRKLPGLINRTSLISWTSVHQNIPLREWKRQATTREEIFSIGISDKGLRFRLYWQLLQINKTK